MKVAQGHAAENWQNVMRGHIHLATKPILFLLLSVALALPLSPSPGPLSPGLPPGPQQGLFPGLIPAAQLFSHHQVPFSTAQSPSL